MNITSKRLDKIKKTKNQSKRRIHYKNKKKNGKEKNRRKNRKYNKSTGKYRKTHKRKKRAYDLKNKSLKFKENQPVNKSAPLKIITTDKPVETVQTGGAPVVPVLKDKLKKLIDRAKNAITGYHKKQDSKIDKLGDAIYAEITQDDKFKALFLILKQATVENLEDATIEKIPGKWYGNASHDDIVTVINKFRTLKAPVDAAEYDDLPDIKDKFLLSIKKIEYDNDNDIFLVTDNNKANIMRLYKLLMRYEIQSLIKKTIGWSDSWNRNFIVNFERIIKSLKQKLTQAEKKKEEAEIAAEKERKEKEREAAAAAEKERKEKEEADIAAEKERKAAAAAEKEREAAAAAEKKRKEKEEAAEKKRKEKEEAAAEKKRKAAAAEKKTEEEINNIKTNIKTPEFNYFLEQVTKKNGPYSNFLEANEGKPFKEFIENSKVMTRGADDERGGAEDEEEGEGAEEGEQQTNDDDDNLVEIYDYLMNKDNQDKIRKYLTEAKNTTELEKFNAMIRSIKLARFAEARYKLPEHDPKIMLVKPGVTGADTAVISTDTSDLKTTDALVDLGNFEQHVKVTENEMNRDKQPGAKEGYVEGKDDD